MTKVLILGARGFLGAAAMERLAGRADYTVIGTARGQTDGLLPCDLADIEALTGLLDAVRPDAIVNCAVTADFSRGVLERLYPVNTLVPGVLALWCARRNTHLVQVSGTLVHGSSADHFGEATPTDPDNDYAISKMLAEDLIRAAGARAAVLRFGGLYGSNGPDHLGLNRAIRAAREGIAPTVYASGSAKRNYLHADDAAAMIEYCLDAKLEGVRWAGGPETLSIREIMQAVCDVYIPGGHPTMLDGTEAIDQIVVTSPDLPAGRPMRDALRSEP